jgi:2-dehydro-3-deoxy-D-gluconate 5-dehydrogenase
MSPVGGTTRRVALVTGASRGIGARIAALLARDGCDVAVASRSVEALEKTAAQCEEHGVRTLVIPTDVTEEPDVRDMVNRAAEELGGLHVLVNNAGGTRFIAPITETRPEGFEKVTRLNLTQVFWALQEAGRLMATQGEGSIVNIASVAGLGAAPGNVAYGASKAALISLTRTAAAEWGPAGVRVNAVAPGWIKTELNRRLWEDPETERALIAQAAFQRWGTVEEVAEVVAFVAGPRASYMTGQTIVIDGGLTLGR